MRVEQGLFQEQGLRQEQILAPQQLQSLEILLAPILELQTKISQELETNPTLEQESVGNEDLAGDVLTGSDTSQKKETQEEKKELDDDGLSELIKLSENWHDSLPIGSSIQSTTENEERRQHYFDSLTIELTLQDQLMEQLNMLTVGKKTQKLAELIIGSIDDTGYLRSLLADLATVAEADIKDMKQALKLVQSFEPAGIGARDIKESLLIQLKRNGNKNKTLAKLVRNHIDDIGSNRLPLITKTMNITMEELQSLIADIKKLNPYPGSIISSSAPIFIVPEVTIKEEDGEFKLISNNDHLPKLRLSKLYTSLLEDPNTDKETKLYIREKLSKSKALMKSLTQRQSTIMLISEVILDAQYDFFKNGIEHLHPLIMQQVADKLDLHETTISRAIANKYVQTPFGLFEFKYFFTTGYQSDAGEDLSSKSVMEKIRDIISKEDTSKPLSDLKLSAILKEEGLTLARRTISKYRESMGIPSSHLRKEY